MNQQVSRKVGGIYKALVWAWKKERKKCVLDPIKCLHL